MAVVRYCQIVEKNSHLIHFFWKASHLVAFLLVIVVSLIAAIDLNLLAVTFGQRCILYPNLEFQAESAYDPIGNIPSNISFHNPHSIWGNQDTCLYVKGTFVFSHVLALILFAFTLILPKGGRANDAVFTQPWKFIPIALVISIIVGLCVCVADHFVQRGLGDFVLQLQARLQSQGYCTVCENVDVFTLVFNTKEQPITNRINSLKKSASIASMSWMFNVITLFLRMILGIDFNIVVYTLSESYRADKPPTSVSSKGSFTINEQLPRMVQHEPERESTDILEMRHFADDFDSDSSIEIKL